MLSIKYLSDASCELLVMLGQVKQDVGRDADEFQRQEQRDQIVGTADQPDAGDDDQQAGVMVGRLLLGQFGPAEQNENRPGCQREQRASTSPANRTRAAPRRQRCARQGFRFAGTRNNVKNARSKPPSATPPQSCRSALNKPPMNNAAREQEQHHLRNEMADQISELRSIRVHLVIPLRRISFHAESAYTLSSLSPCNQGERGRG